MILFGIVIFPPHNVCLSRNPVAANILFKYVQLRESS